MFSAVMFFFFFNNTATTEIYTLFLHDALPIFAGTVRATPSERIATLILVPFLQEFRRGHPELRVELIVDDRRRSEEHTSELQSRQYLVCRLLLEKKKEILPI